MNRKNVIEKIYNALMKQGTLTTKPDVLGSDPIEEKIYTKRLSINKPIGKGPNTIYIKYATISSANDDFNGVTPSDIRINAENAQNKWCNLFIDEVTDDTLEVVETTIS